MASRKQTIQSEEFKRIIFVLGDRGSGINDFIQAKAPSSRYSGTILTLRLSQMA
jgi:hypothetical protein